MDTPYLKKLNELDDFTVAAGSPDPRGWQVVSSDGRDVGRVTDLIVDTTVMKARYLDVEMDQAAADALERHVFVPAAQVTIGEPEQRARRIVIPVTLETARRAARSERAMGEPAVAERAHSISRTRGGDDGGH